MFVQGGCELDTTDLGGTYWELRGCTPCVDLVGITWVFLLELLHALSTFELDCTESLNVEGFDIFARTEGGGHSNDARLQVLDIEGVLNGDDGGGGHFLRVCFVCLLTRTY